jgi:thioesterase domain-containing protein
MTVAAFLSDLRKLDVHLVPDGEELRCNAPAGVLTPELRAELRQKKHEIVRFLKSAHELATQHRAIVPLQPHGSNTPVFAVPGHNGDIYCYRVLAQLLGADQPLFGLQPPGLDDDSEPLTTVEDLAAHFASQIRATCGSGPVILAGYCAGGTIAFELARQLRSAGTHVELVVMLSAAYPTWYTASSQLRHRAIYQSKRAWKHLRAILSGRTRIASLVDAWREKRATDRELVNDRASALRARMKRAIGTAVPQYMPQPLDATLLLVRPNGKHDRNLLRWREFGSRIEEVCGPDTCDGDNMLLDPHVHTIAAILKQRLQSKNV